LLALYGKRAVPFASSPCAKVCNAATYQNAQCSQELDRIHRDTVFFNALFGSILILEIIVPFYGERYVLYLNRREERRGLKLQSLALGEDASATWILNVAPNFDIKNLFRETMRCDRDFSIRVGAARDVVVNLCRACCAKLPLLNPSVHSGLLSIYPANEVTCAETSRRLSSALPIPQRRLIIIKQPQN